MNNNIRAHRTTVCFDAARSFLKEVDPINEGKNAASPAPQDGYKPNNIYIETKSRRLQLLVQPSLYEKIKARANEENISVNALVHSLLKEALTSPNNP